MKVSTDKLRDVLGITHVDFVARKQLLAVVDASLSGMPIRSHDFI